jgi:hypothetical protein
MRIAHPSPSRRLPKRRADARPRPRPSALPLTRWRSGTLPMHRTASFPIHHVKQPSFFAPGSFRVRALFLPLLSFAAADPRPRGLAERPETSSLDTCRAVTRDATLARHEPSRATGRHASRRSAVALSAQVPPPSPLPGPARRLHATSRYGLAAVPGFSCPRLPAAVDATSRSAFRIVSGDAPHERDLRYIAQAR